MPTGIDSCIITIIIILIKQLSVSSKSKIFNMSKITRAQNSCAFDREYSHNGILYYVDIDIAIVNQLSNCESVYSSELKRKIEGSLGRKLPFPTLSAHIKRMLKENILQKNDTQQRGKISVILCNDRRCKKAQSVKTSEN